MSPISNPNEIYRLANLYWNEYDQYEELKNINIDNAILVENQDLEVEEEKQ